MPIKPRRLSDFMGSAWRVSRQIKHADGTDANQITVGTRNGSELESVGAHPQASRLQASRARQGSPAKKPHPFAVGWVGLDPFEGKGLSVCCL